MEDPYFRARPPFQIKKKFQIQKEIGGRHRPPLFLIGGEGSTVFHYISKRLFIFRFPLRGSAYTKNESGPEAPWLSD